MLVINDYWHIAAGVGLNGAQCYGLQLWLERFHDKTKFFNHLSQLHATSRPQSVMADGFPALMTWQLFCIVTMVTSKRVAAVSCRATTMEHGSVRRPWPAVQVSNFVKTVLTLQSVLWCFRGFQLLTHCNATGRKFFHFNWEILW